MINKLIGFVLGNWHYLLLIGLLVFILKKVTHTLLKILLIAVLVCIVMHFTGFNITAFLKGLH